MESGNRPARSSAHPGRAAAQVRHLIVPAAPAAFLERVCFRAHLRPRAVGAHGVDGFLAMVSTGHCGKAHHSTLPNAGRISRATTCAASTGASTAAPTGFTSSSTMPTPMRAWCCARSVRFDGLRQRIGRKFEYGFSASLAWLSRQQGDRIGLAAATGDLVDIGAAVGAPSYA